MYLRQAIENICGIINKFHFDCSPVFWWRNFVVTFCRDRTNQRRGDNAHVSENDCAHHQFFESLRQRYYYYFCYYWYYYYCTAAFQRPVFRLLLYLGLTKKNLPGILLIWDYPALTIVTCVHIWTFRRSHPCSFVIARPHANALRYCYVKYVSLSVSSYSAGISVN